MPATTETKTLHLEIQKECKHSIQYAGDDHTFYVRRDLLEELGNPKSITVTIEAE